MKVPWFGKRVSERCAYASKEEFVSVFECERAALQRLALLLTPNSEIAMRCLSRAFQDCIASCSVSREKVFSWTRRMVIRNAIGLIDGYGGDSFVSTNDGADNGLFAFCPDDSPASIDEYEAILELPECDRFVFVICVLERYSIYDCALLLGRPPRDINEARQRVCNHAGQINELGNSSQRFAMR